MSLNFDAWYAENAKYMNTTDFEAWMLEAWEAGTKNEREKVLKLCKNWDFNVQGLIKQIKEK